MRTLIRSTLLAACLSALVPAVAAAQSCPSPPAAPAAADLPAARTAILCLVNAERRSHGLPALRQQRKLRTAARHYAHAMATRNFFSHDQSGLIKRVRHAGYLRHAKGWALGENIAWGGGASGSPSAIVKAWMASPPHRRNILSREFRRIGIGIDPGAPVAGSTGATYVTDFGTRRG